MIRVLIVDDEALIRSGLRALLDGEVEVEVVGEAANGQEAVTLARRLSPDVILMDVQMPVTDGVEATRQIMMDDELNSTRVIITTSFPCEQHVIEALRAGASGFLVKDTATEDLVKAVRIVASGGELLSPSVTHHLIADIRARPTPKPLHPDLAALLTVREREVASLVATGLSNHEIAERLFITPATAKTHVGRVLGKVGLRNRAQLVSFAYETGLATPVRTNHSDGRAGRV
jgi:DNA-binding NarL/FixJ family response regulator